MGQQYSVTPYKVETLLAWVKSGEIAIPEIQRPFVWDSTKVRNLLDSLYAGYPVGYLITWRNPNVRLKDGSLSAGKRILIDGQQRMTALMASLLGWKVINKDYKSITIRIAFNPQVERFEVVNPAIEKDPEWITDISTVFALDSSLLELSETYAERNPAADKRSISLVLERLRRIIGNDIGVIDLNNDLDIETVTEIFIRVNSSATPLSQADFAMSKIAVNETYGGNMLRKAIDYFCHLAVAPDSLAIIESDVAFASTDYLQQMRWLRNVHDDLYDPTYSDMLRVAFTSEFRRGRLQDLVALLSGRNFETRQYEESIMEESFARLRRGVFNFMNQTHFERFLMILRSAGFVTGNLVGSRTAVNFAYILYLGGRAEAIPPADLECLVRRWYAMSVLRGRYTGSAETMMDMDIRGVSERGLRGYTDTVIESELPETFWAGMLPQAMATSSATSPYFIAFRAAQAKLGDKGFLSRDISVRDLLINRSDVHHLYPRNYLKKQGLPQSQYNQIANLVVAQSEINIAIGDKPPQQYFGELAEQAVGGPKRYGGITALNEMCESLRQNCVPVRMLDGDIPTYDSFLVERRRLMALHMKTWFEAL